ncbi:hypothetical protein [Flavobacterium suncheonense]|uniref:Uncharacterized protein n=1 Tax=Flavobacterium suncheonense GH29-5 = DSM 17707 TaxID=1121899 RepID=A0A0A2MDM4_9FLAO|nr:hypothetical protein [Flavobacterium suncheonense]KGO89558.1 hypothetical protein Q764_07245 [Flavobacterium suncheonense GH29-5 = DSM 17707]
MIKETQLLENECKKVESSYMSKRKQQKSLENMAFNTKLMSEFAEKDSQKLVKKANEILSKNNDDPKLKIELEKILKKYFQQIPAKIFKGN